MWPTIRNSINRIGLNANRQMTVEADQTDEVNQTGEDGHDIRDNRASQFVNRLVGGNLTTDFRSPDDGSDREINNNEALSETAKTPRTTSTLKKMSHLLKNNEKITSSQPTTSSKTIESSQISSTQQPKKPHKVKK